MYNMSKNMLMYWQDIYFQRTKRLQIIIDLRGLFVVLVLYSFEISG